MSPLKQLKAGIAVSDIKCKEGLVLVIKESNEHPACMKPATATRLLSNGWITLEKFETTHSILQQNKTGIPTPHNINTTSNSVTKQNHASITTHGTKSDIVYENNTTSSGDNNRYPIGPVPVHTSGPSSVINVRNLPPIPKCTYSNYFCSSLPNHVIPMPPINANPIISLSRQNIIKIVSVGMFPNPLKVGDIPSFTTTYQNVSDKPLYGVSGCGSDLFYTISPLDSLEKVGYGYYGAQCATGNDVIQPNQTITDRAYPSLYNYKVIKNGQLNVTLSLLLDDNYSSYGLHNINATVQFNVNATGTNSIDNGTGNGININANSNTINLVTQNATIPIPAIITTTRSNTIKIISAGISSNPLRVGDEPEFTLTFQNISDKTIYENTGCNIAPVSLTISPADNAFGPLYESIKSGCKDSYHSPIYPNQMITTQASPDLQNYETYLISKPGKLDVYMILFLEDEKSNPINSVLQFSTKVVGGPIFENCSGLPSYGGGNCGGSGVMYSGTVNASNLPPLPPHPHPAPKLSFPSYPPVLVEPVSNSDFVKILSIGMWPNQLKVGDKPTFSVTYQNISNDTIYIGEGCQTSSVYYEMYPPSSVSTERPSYLCGGSSRTVVIEPNKVITDITTISYEQKPVTVIKSGKLTVKVTIRFSTSLSGGGSSYTIQFNVNATQ